MTTSTAQGNGNGQVLGLPSLGQITRASIADQVFGALQQKILSLELPPGTKLSEVDVATQMDVSRQPVRDAFYRLSQLGFLLIRPQRATVVSLISEAAVLRAQFIRTALETETCRTACKTLTTADFAVLQGLVDAQKKASDTLDKKLFHALDDQFHREICARSGLGFAWDLIHESKAHMDRVRMLSLDKSSDIALNEHREILAAMIARDGEATAEAMRRHLARIRVFVAQIKVQNHQWFAEGDE